MYEPIKASNAVYSKKNVQKLHIPTKYLHVSKHKVMKNVLPIAKDEKELKKWCTVASNRAMNDEVKNPY